MFAAIKRMRQHLERRGRRLRQRLIPWFPRRYINRSGVDREGYYGGDRSLKLTLNINEENSTSKKSVVCYKDDINRFKQQHTLWLQTFSRYVVALEVEEDQELVFIRLGGRKYCSFHVEKNTDRKTKVHSFLWCTDKIRTVRRKHYSLLACVFRFKSCTELWVDLRVKFYASDDTSLTNLAMSSMNSLSRRKQPVDEDGGSRIDDISLLQNAEQLALLPLVNQKSSSSFHITSEF